MRGLLSHCHPRTITIIPPTDCDSPVDKMSHALIGRLRWVTIWGVTSRVGRVTPPGVVSTVRRRWPDFPRGLPDKSAEGFCIDNVVLRQIRTDNFTCLAVNGQCSLRPIRRRFLACFLTLHSSSPQTFSPLESITRCATSPWGHFTADVNRRSSLDDSGIIRAAQRNANQGKMESIQPCAVHWGSRNVRLITRIVVVAWVE